MTVSHRRPRRRLFALLPVVALTLVLAPTPAAVAPARAVTGITTVAQAEARLVVEIDQERVKAGLVPLQVDRTLMAIARGRSRDMVARGYFGHVDPDGRTYADRLAASGLVSYRSGETIARDHYPTLLYSVAITRYQWMHSAPHRAILLSSAFNYVGVGLAVASDGRHVWTAVFSRSPDHTGARATGGTARLGTVVSGRRMVTIPIRAADVRLQALTAGLRDVQVQRRVDGGRWVSLGWTTATSLRKSLTVRHRYDFRFRARDRAGNIGAWSRVVTVRP
jgi:uncharacterized protein YkwD